MKKYYIVYHGECYSGTTAIGRCTHIADKKIKTYKDIVEVEERIERQLHFKSVVILNYKRIKL